MPELSSQSIILSPESRFTKLLFFFMKTYLACDFHNAVILIPNITNIVYIRGQLYTKNVKINYYSICTSFIGWVRT